MDRSELDVLFDQFREECIWLQHCFNTHSHLFDGGPETDRILKHVAYHFFYDLSRILQEYYIQRVCLLTDPARTAGKANLSVAGLNEGLREQQLLTSTMVDLAKALEAYRALIIDARNRFLSHMNQQAVLSGQSLGAHQPDDIGRFFENLQQYCDEVGNALGVGPLDINVTPGKGDVVDLLRHLKQSVVR